MLNEAVVDLSRWQFALTALYHFLFVPLTLGLTFILAAMETVYVTTGRPIYREMARFWGKLFGINFALGVATGLTMEFEFGTNWSTYSSFVGDIFGAPLAIEGLMAFFLESTFVGLMIFGWERLGRGQHLFVTYMVALGSNLSALWILVANSFMQHPVGATFNPLTMRLELKSLVAVIFNPDAQAKFVHTTVAGYVTAAVFVMGVSAWYLLKDRHNDIARRSFRIAAFFGIFSAIAVISLGDALAFVTGRAQPTKIAAMEALWQNEKPPVAFNLAAIPDEKKEKNDLEIQIPWLLDPLVTHTMNTPIPGIRDLEAQAKIRIRNGIPAVAALKRLSLAPGDREAMSTFRAHEKDLGYGWLVARYAPDPEKATEAQIDQAARDTIPPVGLVFWFFRVMVAIGFALLVYMVYSAHVSLRRELPQNRRLLRLALFMIPMPFLANEAGWITAEVGRQPWTVYEILPTWMSASTHAVGSLVFSMIGFVSIYTVFIIIEMVLMVRAIRKGPDQGHAAAA